MVSRKNFLSIIIFTLDTLFATITGSTRAQMYRFVTDHNLENDIVAFATDSICTTRDLNL